MAGALGLRSLALIRASGSTARVLNLARVHERFGETEEFKAKPLFKNTTLNRSLIVKHVVRHEEQSLFEFAPTVTTKILVPFATKELELGGQVLMIGEQRFERALLGLYNPGDTAAFESDLDLLRLLHTLPSLDPFLMRERLRQNGIDAAACFFDMSQADIAKMRAFVGKEIEQLVGLAYANGGSAARELSSKLAEKLMTDETAKPLDPLRETLRLSAEDYREGVFAWKGFLYYKWMTRDLLPRLPKLSQELLRARVNGVDPADRVQLSELRKTIVDHLNQASQHVQDALLNYGNAFAALTEGKPGEFRAFLLNAPTLFIPIGEAIGVIKHIESFWEFRFPKGAPMLLAADEAFQLFTELHATLGAMECLADLPTAMSVDA